MYKPLLECCYFYVNVFPILIKEIPSSYGRSTKIENYVKREKKKKETKNITSKNIFSFANNFFLLLSMYSFKFGVVGILYRRIRSIGEICEVVQNGTR